MIYLAFEKHTWGCTQLLHEDKNCKIVSVELKAAKSLNYQFHEMRSETITIIEGEGLVTLNDEKFILSKGDCIKIPKGAIHKIKNTLVQKLIFIEIQTGKVLCDKDVKEIDEEQIVF
jgi:mannose-6-phosphate isomerase-like protein (cupin superfamily)